MIYTKFLILTLLLLASCASPQSPKEMTVTSFSEEKSFDSKSPVFTGNVKVQLLFGTHPEDSFLTAGKVTFSSHARSAWHTHPRGSSLS